MSGKCPKKQPRVCDSSPLPSCPSGSCCLLLPDRQTPGSAKVLCCAKDAVVWRWGDSKEAVLNWNPEQQELWYPETFHSPSCPAAAASFGGTKIALADRGPACIPKLWSQPVGTRHYMGSGVFLSPILFSSFSPTPVQPWDEASGSKDVTADQVAKA